MRPHARIALPGGSVVAVPAGGLIGRHVDAALPIDDPRVSEVHGLLSLRGRGLVLIVLNGLVRVDNRTTSEVVLEVGQRIALLPDLVLEVTDIQLPDGVLALTGLGEQALELCHEVASVHLDPPALIPGYDPGAPAHVWSTSVGFVLSIGGKPGVPVVAGSEWTVQGKALGAVMVPVERRTRDTVRQDPFARALTVVVRYESVHLRRADGRLATVHGLPARLLTELARFDAPTPWNWVAGELWKDDADPRKLRQRWDRTLQSLRKTLREKGIRGDLVRSDQRGNVELLLRDGDSLVDES